MRTLALDIGVGTTDIMLIDNGRNPENCAKMVLPSAAQTHASAVFSATKARKDLFVTGDTVGGGQFASALRKHLSSGLKVTMNESAAFSVRNDLDEVRERGIEVSDRAFPASGFAGEVLWLQEVRLRGPIELLRESGEVGRIDLVAVAVQDHGVSIKGVSNRTTRIERFRKTLSAERRLESLAYRADSIPEEFIRMRSAARRAHTEVPEAEIFVMDTSPAAALGCLADPQVDEVECILAVNLGNGHTLAVLIERGEVLGGFEAHTAQFAGGRGIGDYVRGFLDGGLTNEEVFGEGGHGLFRLEEDLPAPDRIMATGPNRRLMEFSGLEFRYATPAGDVMMTGPMGLHRAIKAVAGQ
ncbi:MAG: pyruvate formate lyase-activating protein [Euryarchaeota archaeon]|nr:pyruvate formate lyase-activating protein [Euryarchaeota archaeon]